MDKNMFSDMVKAVRETETLLGKSTYELSELEQHSRLGRRSLFVVKDISEGEKFTADNVKSIRPAAGLAPDEIENILGKKATRDIKLGTPMDLKFIK